DDKLTESIPEGPAATPRAESSVGSPQTAGKNSQTTALQEGSEVLTDKLTAPGTDAEQLPQKSSDAPDKGITPREIRPKESAADERQDSNKHAETRVAAEVGSDRPAVVQIAQLEAALKPSATSSSSSEHPGDRLEAGTDTNTPVVNSASDRSSK